MDLLTFDIQFDGTNSAHQAFVEELSKLLVRSPTGMQIVIFSNDEEEDETKVRVLGN